MKAALLRVLVCSECQKSLRSKGTTSGRRLASGVLQCPKSHLFQINGEIAILKDPKLSQNEFEWEIKFPNISRYDKIRKQYASYLSESQIKADALLLDQIAKRIPRTGVVLDLASGMGTLLLVVSNRSPSEAQILGTDVSESPLRGVLLKLKQQNSYERVSLTVMDGKHLAVKSKRLSCITSYFGFNNIPQTKKALKEASRVLMAKGKLVFAALSLNEGSRSFRRAEKLGYLDIATESRLATALEETGFQVDSIEEFYSGEWSRNPMDRLPLEGDWFAHLLVRSHKK